MLYTLNALRDRGVHLTVACTERSEVVQELEKRQYPVILCAQIRRWPTTVMMPATWSLSGLKNLITWILTWRSSVNAARGIIQGVKPDIVHLNMSPLVPAAMAAVREKIPVVWHVREELNTRKIPIEASLNLRAIRDLASYVVTVNEENLQQFGEMSNATVIYDSVFFEEFDRGIDGRDFRRSIGCSDDNILVGVLNHVAWIKGTIVFARAAKLCLQEETKLIFINVGEHDTPSQSWQQSMKRRIAKALRVPRYVERVLREIEEEQARGQFIFVDPLIDVRLALAALDILVFPAMTSHSPLPVIESAAMAKPVVASDWPAVREIITHSRNGLLFQPGDHVALAEAILQLARNSELRVGMGENNYEMAVQRFDLRKNIKKVISIYQRVLATE